MLINRNGYGSNFNVLQRVNNKIIKKSKNSYGDEKIENEINFYRYILNQQNGFCVYVPKIHKIVETEHIIEMEYLDEYSPLYLHFPSYSKEKKRECLKSIMDALLTLHNTSIPIDKSEFENDLWLETKTKIKSRTSPIFSIIQNYDFIQSVNHTNIQPFWKIINKIEENVKDYMNNPKLVYEYGMIHGDCQFNNIMINNDGDLKFIDPRGYYGTSRIYGLVDYDLAKICFALSGYDQFDNNTIKELNMRGYNIDIDFEIEKENETFIREQSTIVKTLMCAIWLGNAHIFQEDKNKCVTSYFIAMFMCSKFLTFNT